MKLTEPVAMVYRIWIASLPPKVSNRAMSGWKSYHYPRKKWLRGAALALYGQLGTVLPHDRVAVKITAYVPKLADQDNADSRYRKATHDLLVIEGMVPDDSAAHLEAHPVTQVAIGSKPRSPSNPFDLPRYGKALLAYGKKVGIMVEITVLDEGA